MIIEGILTSIAWRKGWTEPEVAEEQVRGIFDQARRHCSEVVAYLCSPSFLVLFIQR